MPIPGSDIGDQRNEVLDPFHHDCQAIKPGTLVLLGTDVPLFDSKWKCCTLSDVLVDTYFQRYVPLQRPLFLEGLLNRLTWHQATIAL